MNKIIFILILLFINISCNKIKEKGINSNSKKNEFTNKTTLNHEEDFPKSEKLEIEPYDFDTILKNNFHLSYRVYKDSIENEILQSLTLVKGKKDIKKISETSFPMLHKNLGYIGADYGNSFLFVKSYGSENPHEIEIIEKENGKVITTGVLVDQNEVEKVLLYIKNEHERNEKLILLDIKNNKEKIITDFNKIDLECSCIGGLRNCIAIDTITKNQIIIKTTSEKNKKTKKYNR